MKVIHINNFSSSLLLEDYEADIIANFYSKTAQEIKKYHPELDVECWTPERRYSKERSFKRNGIRYRVFPSFAFAFGREISLKMLKGKVILIGIF